MTETCYPTEGELSFEDKERGVLRGSCIESVSTVTSGGKLYRREYRFYITIRCMDNIFEMVFSNISPKTLSHSTTEAGILPYSKAVYDSIKLDLFTLAEDCYRSICEEKKENQ